MPTTSVAYAQPYSHGLPEPYGHFNPRIHRYAITYTVT